MDIQLDPREVKTLPLPKHSAVPSLVARTDEVSGTGNELIVLTPGKEGLKVLPYGSKFSEYDLKTGFPVFELPDGTFTNDEPAPEKTEQEAPTT